jgi:predicted PurR-regulated permease PerM
LAANAETNDPLGLLIGIPILEPKKGLTLVDCLTDWIFMTKYKSHIIFLVLIIASGLIFYFIGDIILPFIIALFAAYLLNPTIKGIQRIIPNRTLAVTTFLVGSTLITLFSVFLLGNHVAKDFQRLTSAFEIFTEKHSEEIEHVKTEVGIYVEKIYSEEKKAKEKNAKASRNSEGIDEETIKSVLTNLASLIGSNNDEQQSRKGINWFVLVLSAMGYFIYIIYGYAYFEGKFEKYFGGERVENNMISEFLHDFQSAFLIYFKQRSKIVLIASAFFITAFLLIGVPGAIIAGLVAGILCYIPHFHYLGLIPLALSCWAVSIEKDGSFMVYFGLVILTFVILSIVEELVLFPKLMKGVSAMNPSIMLISLAVWSHVFGTFGLLIALPLTTVLLIYLDRILLKRKELVDS